MSLFNKKKEPDFIPQSQYQCPACGAQFSKPVKFCIKCGAPQTMPSPAQTSAAASVSPEQLAVKSKSGIFHRSNLKEENERLRAMLTPEMQDALKMRDYLDSLQEQLNLAEQKLAKKEHDITILETNYNHRAQKYEDSLRDLNTKIAQKKNDLIVLDEEILVQEFGLYQPVFDFAKADDYKERLSQIRTQQKNMIKNGTAATGNMNWTVNGSSSKGKKMVKDMQKLLLRAFNSECDELVSKVKYNNFDTYLKRMHASRDAISKLGSMMDIAISQQYLNLKTTELHLAFEYQQKKQAEKEALREARAQMREAAKLQKEIEEQRKKVEKERTHYKNALLQVLKQIGENETPAKELLDKKAELESQLGEIDIAIKDLDYREANQRAGYVYVISNIGAFGKDVYKIGMTRRLDPQDRVDELGDASVPFNFDVHAMIFSDDAPALENALHKAFENKKLNLVNQRREFFHVTLDEIKDVVRKNYDKTVEFTDVPDAEQYRESLKMRQAMS